MRKLAIGRIIGLIIAVVSLGAAFFFGVLAYRFNEEFHEWMTARPMETSIDFSKPGTVSAPFYQTCSISHGEAIMLDCNIKDDKGNIPDGLLIGLLARLVITDEEGMEIVNTKLSDIDVSGIDSQIMLADVPTFKTGNYMATISIDSGLPALANHPQTVYAKYQLCGLEQVPALVRGIFSFCAGLVGLVAGLTVVPGLISFGVWRDVSKEN